jgi:hypothetical protein
MKYNAWLLTSLVAFFTLMVTPQSLAQVTEVRATVDKNPLIIDEAVQLVVTAQGSPSTKQLDLSALETDFRLSSTNVSQSTRSINFNTTKTTTWVTQLFPRSTGKFTIPSITVDGKSTKPIELIVMPVGSGQGSAPRDFFLTAEVDMSEVYLQQQIKYTTKLFMRRNIQRGSILAPELENAIIKQVGEDKEYEDIQNGVRYRVIERVFAIIPQQSGAFTIGGAVFQGSAASNTSQSFGFISRSKPINRVSPNIALTVLPIPDNYSDHWLPSEFVEISEEWQQKPEEFVVGEPITRTITITAAGLVEEQLPDITSMYPPDFKLYPDQAKTITVERAGVLFAQKTQSTAIIPNKAGTFVIGETKVPWFNVVTKQTEYAVLPARSVKVRQADGAKAEEAQNTIPNDMRSNENEQGAASQYGIAPISGLDWLHISLILLWLATVAVFVLVMLRFKHLGLLGSGKQMSMNVSGHSNNIGSPKENALWNTVNKSILSANQQQVNQALKLWLSVISRSDVHSINETFARLGANSSAVAFNDWVKSMYGKETQGLATTNDTKVSVENKQLAAKVLLKTLSDLRAKYLKDTELQRNKLALYPE